MNPRNDETEIRVGQHTVRLDERERRLLKDIRAGRSRLIRHITDSQSLHSLIRKSLVYKHKGPWKPDIKNYARTGCPMSQQEEAHLSRFGTNTLIELERIEREQTGRSK